MLTESAPPSPQLNINEASKFCGLSPSVLRIWELRYGWPNPKRKPNGYRVYTTHQVQELRRVANLVRAGTPISELIVDGLPRWPSDQTHVPAPRALVRTRALAAPSRPSEALLHRTLIDALETRRGPQIIELLQRIFWSVRPADEPRVALVPTLVALAEHRQADRQFAEAAAIAQMIQERCLQLLRLVKIEVQGEPLQVVPTAAGERPLAALVALILSFQGAAARPWLGTEAAPAADISCGPARPDERAAHRVSALSDPGATSLADLLDGAADLLAPSSALGG
jgi:DNA-binding transcriptional MerR regulator